MKIFNHKHMQLSAAVIVACLISPLLAEGSQKSLSSTLDIYAFPKKGQESKQQSQDEAECYSWAVNNSGSDPFDLQKQMIDHRLKGLGRGEKGRDIAKHNSRLRKVGDIADVPL